MSNDSTGTPPRLVYGDDGSLEADRAWLWVNAQAWSGWAVDVLECRQPPFGPPVGDERAMAHEWTPDTPRVVNAEAGFAAVRHLLAEEDPRIGLTEQTDAALVVLGRTGHGTWKQMHLGSTTEYVVQHPPAPVVIAKKAGTVRTVVVAVDGSAHATRALEAFLDMPWLDQVEAVHVVGTYQVGIADDREQITAAGADAVRRVGDAPGITCAPEAHTGDEKPSLAIVGIGERTSADLVVLGTRGLSVFRRALLWGSTAATVVRSSECSVLVAHRDM